MNLSVNGKVVELSCDTSGLTYFAITELPSGKLFINLLLAIVLNAILIVPTILLNAVSVLTILKSYQLNSKPCYFIVLVQSVFDLTVGVLAIPLFIFFMTSEEGRKLNCFAAQLAVRSTFMLMRVSTVTLSAMTLERYIAILHPFAYSIQVTKKKLLAYIGFHVTIMFLAIILSFHSLALIHLYANIITIFLFALTAFVYTRIYLVVRKFTRPPNQLHVGAHEKNLTRRKLFLREIRHANSCFVVVFCFSCLVFLPRVISAPFYTNADKFEKLAIGTWVLTLAFLNSSLNSVIFFWTKTMLRKEACKMLNIIKSH